MRARGGRRRRRTLAQIILRQPRPAERIGVVPADIEVGERMRVDGRDDWVVVESEPLEGQLAERRVIVEREPNDV